MFTLSETEPPLITGDDEAAVHRRALAREFFASALYVALVLLAALVALPRDRLPTDHAVMATLFGTALGLVLATSWRSGSLRTSPRRPVVPRLR